MIPHLVRPPSLVIVFCVPSTRREGTSLVSLGRAHCQVATLQEAYSVLFHETYFASIQRVEDDIKEYQSQRKKLDSRR